MIALNPNFTSPEERKLLHGKYNCATPFQHLIIDHLFEAECLSAIVSEFTQIRHNTKYTDQTTFRKNTCDDWEQFPPATFEFISYLNCGKFVRFLSDIAGIQGLIGDPFLLGGGLHETLPGGFLKMHTDFNFHQSLRLDRRINAILFLNEGWQPSWGGELILADPAMQLQVKVEPLFNRLVIFNTNDFSFHGQPDPHTFPEGNSRKSIAMYYYSNGRPEHETLSDKVGTTYKARYSGDMPLVERLKEVGRLLAGSKRAR